MFARSCFRNHVLKGRYCYHQSWLEDIDLKALSDSSLKTGHQTRRILGDADHYFSDVSLSEDVVASVNLGSGQNFMVSEKSLVCTHLRYKDLCLEQLKLFPEDEIDLKEVDQIISP